MFSINRIMAVILIELVCECVCECVCVCVCEPLPLQAGVPVQLPKKQENVDATSYPGWHVTTHESPDMVKGLVHVTFTSEEEFS